MKIRIWTGRATLASEQGKEVTTFEQMESWLKKQPDGQIEVWAGRWFVVSREARPFMLTKGKVFCDYRPYFGSKSREEAMDMPGFFAFEAWKRAKRASDFWAGVPKMVDGLV